MTPMMARIAPIMRSVFIIEKNCEGLGIRTREKARWFVVIDESGCLHEGVGDHRAEEFEAPTFQINCEGCGFGTRGAGPSSS
jgi:hypothetical protein